MNGNHRCSFSAIRFAPAWLHCIEVCASSEMSLSDFIHALPDVVHVGYVHYGSVEEVSWRGCHGISCSLLA